MPSARERTIRLIAGSLLLTAAIAGASSLRLSATHAYFAGQRPEDLYYLPPPAWLRVFDAGFHDAAADLTWTSALVYYGSGFAGQIGLRHVLDYAETIVALDPTFEPAMIWAGTAAAYQPVAPPIEDLERTARFLGRSSERLPASGGIAWAAGAFYAFELAPRYPPGSAERRRARVGAEPFLLRAARLGAGPPWLGLSNATMLVQLGERERAIEHLSEMYALSNDETVRAGIVERIAALRSQADAEALARSLRAAERAWRESYPYLPPALYELVGPRSLLDGTSEPAIEE